MKCKQCGNEYEAKRSTSKYCSGQCRKLAFQNGKGENAKQNANSDWHTEKGQEILGDLLEQLDEPEHKPNPLAVPGDPDYVGCCKLVDGEWTVDNTKPDVKNMSDDELLRRLHYIKDWRQGPEHQEVLRRRGNALTLRSHKALRDFNREQLQAAGACV